VYPLLAVLSGKARVGEEPLAGMSTLSRLELGGETPSRYKKIRYREVAIDELLTQVFLEAHDTQHEVERIVRQIRAVWPAVRIIVRTDSGFCREDLMKSCEDNGVYYVIGFARNERLRRIIGPQAEEAARLHQQSGQPVRVFTEFSYPTTTGSWSCARRVVAKAEQLEGKQNPRFVVTNLSAARWRIASRSSCRCSPGG